MGTPELVVQRPSLLREFARAALTSGGRPGLRGSLPDTSLRMPAVRIDRDNLFAYQKLCGFTAGELLPPTYPHLLGFPLQARLMAAPEFPLPLAGLVHLSNEVTLREPLSAGDTPDIIVGAENLRAHPKGVTVDLVTRVETAGATAWESRSTYLRRGPAAPGGQPTAQDDAMPAAPEARPSAKWRIAADIGRRYAAVSGDVNPIHLHPWTARALGFPRAIAHGMWTYARTLAALGPQVAQPGTSRVWFRKPVFLPSTVRLVRGADGPARIAALVSSGGEPKTHLVTVWTPQ